MFHMNVYDWDNTIYRGDSTFGFIRYLFIKRPKTLRNLPRTLGCGLLYVCKLMEKRKAKENFFHMFTYVDDMEEVVDAFTTEKLNHVKDFYKQFQQDDDVVISASPDFLISSFCKKVGIQTCIASPVDIHTGKYYGENCHGQEKVKRFEEVFGKRIIEAFYSDSLSDTPLAKLANDAYLVKGDKLKKWPQ